MSRLYPGWGSGTRPFEGTFVANSMACADREDLETGDKVILPQSTLKDISRLRLPLPIMFEVFNPRLGGNKNSSNNIRSSRSTDPRRPPGRQPATNRPSVHGSSARRQTRPTAGSGIGATKGGGHQRNTKNTETTEDTNKVKQFCGVIEFSAPENVVFMPFWMMQNLRIKEGSQVRFKSVFAASVPKGIACKLQPHSTEFLDVAAGMDLRMLFEECFRNYSGLSAGETICISVFGTKFKLNVLETTPAGPLISLYGTVDLEVDFAAPLDSPAMGRIRPSQSKAKLPTHDDADHLVQEHAGSQNQSDSGDSMILSALQRAGGASLLAGEQTVIDVAPFMGSSNIAATVAGSDGPSNAAISNALAEAVLAASKQQRNPSKFAKRTTSVSSVFQGAGRSMTGSHGDNASSRTTNASPSGCRSISHGTEGSEGSSSSRSTSVSAMDALGPGRKLTDYNDKAESSQRHQAGGGSDSKIETETETTTASPAELRRRRLEFYASVAA